MKKSKIVCIILITSILLLLIYISANVYLGSKISCKIESVKIEAIETSQISKIIETNKNYLSNNEKKELQKNPQKYKFIDLTCKIKNDTPLYISDIKAFGQLNEEMSKAIVGQINVFKGDATTYDLYENADAELDIYFLINLGNKSKEEVEKYISEGRFNLCGYSWPFVIQCDIKYLNKYLSWKNSTFVEPKS